MLTAHQYVSVFNKVPTYFVYYVLFKLLAVPQMEMGPKQLIDLSFGRKNP